MIELLLTYVLPAVIITVTICVFVWLVDVYRHAPQRHMLQSRQFWVHTLLPMLILNICGIISLILGGIQWTISCIDYFHFHCYIPVRNAFPLCVAIATTIIGLAIMFRFFYPRLRIHPLVAHERNSKGDWLTFLVENIDVWESYDINAKLYRCSFDDNGNRENMIIHEIKLGATKGVNELGWFFGHEIEKSLLVETEYNELNMAHLQKTGDLLELRVCATHPISRVKKVFTSYFNYADIVDSEFNACMINWEQCGNSLNVDFNQKKEKLWKWSNVFKIVEILLLGILLFSVIIYDVVPVQNEMPICFFEYGYYILIIAISITELLRQITQRPIYITIPNVSMMNPSNEDNSKNIQTKDDAFYLLTLFISIIMIIKLIFKCYEPKRIT